MKILLLIPPEYRNVHTGYRMWSSREYKDGYFNEPHNPYLAASILGVLRHGMPDLELKVLDAQLEGWDKARATREVNVIKPDLIVALMNFAGLDQDKHFAELAYPTIAVMQAYIDHREAVELYGIEAMAFTKEEIEYTVLEAVREFAGTGRIEKTPGLLIRENGGRGAIGDTGPRPVTDLAQYPFPAFDLFPMERYMALQKQAEGCEYIFLYTTRGCPFGCHFCQAGTAAYKTVRRKTPDQVIEEMRYFIKRGFKHFYFYDDEFAIDMARAKEICRRIISENLNIRFACYNTANLVDEELLSLMSRAGCKLIRYGLETGDMSVQKAMKTYVDEAELVRAFDMTHKYGIFIDTFVMVGLPGETQDSVRQTLDLLKRVKPHRVTMSICFPKPYSLLYKQLKAEGRLIEKQWHRHLYSPTLTFTHENYKSMQELAAMEKWLRVQFARWMAGRDLVGNYSGRNAYTRIIRYLHHYEPVKNAIRWVRSKPLLFNALAAPYQRGSKFEY